MKNDTVYNIYDKGKLITIKHNDFYLIEWEKPPCIKIQIIDEKGYNVYFTLKKGSIVPRINDTIRMGDLKYKVIEVVHNLDAQIIKSYYEIEIFTERLKE